MKRLTSVLTAAIILLSSFVSAPSANAAESKTSSSAGEKSLLAMMPSFIIIEQTAKLNDGRSVTLYYKKDGDFCEVYSESSLKGLSEKDLLKLESSEFRIVTSANGKCVHRTTVAEARKYIKQIVNKYL